MSRAWPALFLLSGCAWISDDHAAERIDLDADGIVNSLDCDPEDAAVGGPLAFYPDNDADGFGVESVPAEACTAPEGWVLDATDCDGNDAAVFPGADEHCDGRDEDCDGELDEDPVDPITWYADADGDGWGLEGDATTACDQPSGYAAEPGDCDDSTEGVNPDALESCDGVDQDCDGEIDDDAVDQESWYSDLDQDGYGDDTTLTTGCSPPDDAAYVGGDCDDGDGTAWPGATETCDGVDDDCDGDSDENAEDMMTWFADADGDAYGDVADWVDACEAPEGYVADAEDCDDTRADVSPGASELCGDVDEDCDGAEDADAIDASTWYADADGDFYGSDSVTTIACDAPFRYISTAGDCDDADAADNPAASESVADGDDDDCDGFDSCYEDADADTHGSATILVSNDLDCDDAGESADATDCDDADAAVFPGTTEVCNGIDDDCDTTVDRDGIATLNGTNYIVLQDALNAASSGDTINVCAGTWYEAIDFGGRDVAVVGIGGSGATILDSAGTAESAVLFQSGETSAASLTGFTIRNSGGRGIFVYGTSPTLTDVVVEDTTHSYGGAVYVDGGEPSFVSCSLTGGTADVGALLYVTGSSSVSLESCALEDGYANYYGSSIYLDGGDVTLTSSDVTGNFAYYDGGVYVEYTASLTATDTSFTDNGGYYTDGSAIYAEGYVTLVGGEVSGNGPVYADSGYTGAIWLEYGVLDATGVTFSSNTGYDGGAIYAYSGTVSLLDSVVSDNYAWARGGGLYASGAAAVTLRTTSFESNSAGGDGGGAYLAEGSITASSAAIEGNSAGDLGGATYVYSGTLTSNVSDWGGTTANSSPEIVVRYDGSSTETGYEYGVGDSFSCTSSSGSCY